MQHQHQILGAASSLLLLILLVLANTFVTCDGFVQILKKNNHYSVGPIGSICSSSSASSATVRQCNNDNGNDQRRTPFFTSTSLLMSKSLNNDNTSSSPSPLYVDATTAASTATSTSTAASKSSTTQRTLTPQERILKEALGIEPETKEEKQQRTNKRLAKIEKIQNEKKKNIAVAVVAFGAACLNYFWQYTHPVTSLSLLTDMQRKSDDIALIGNNGKPTVVDFWAPWCENCKSAAPTLASIEDEYRNRVNFVMVNGDLGENWPLIERFGVDAIPHLAMVGSDGVVETALIGPIPKSVLRADLDTMIENGKRRTTTTTSSSSSSGDSGTDVVNEQQQAKIGLPYTMYDAFRATPDLRKVSF